jgi:hypothetical protein
MDDIERGMSYIIYIIGGVCLALVICKLLGLPL